MEFILEAIKFLLWGWWTNILIDIGLFADKMDEKKKH
jgi:hypothetical protein